MCSLSNTLKLSFSRFLQNIIESNIWAKILNVFWQKYFMYVGKKKEMILFSECSDIFKGSQNYHKDWLKCQTGDSRISEGGLWSRDRPGFPVKRVYVINSCVAVRT